VGGRRWSEREDAVLREKYPSLGGQKLAEVLERAPTTVYIRAHKLGLRCTDKRMGEVAADRARKAIEPRKMTHRAIRGRHRAGRICDRAIQPTQPEPFKMGELHEFRAWLGAQPNGEP
jgi:hypothetical protein